MRNMSEFRSEGEVKYTIANKIVNKFIQDRKKGKNVTVVIGIY